MSHKSKFYKLLINSNSNEKLLSNYLNFLSVKVLNGGIVFLDEASRNELHGQGRLSNTARTQNNHFEFTHFCKFSSRINKNPKSDDSAQKYGGVDFSKMGNVSDWLITKTATKSATVELAD